MYLISIRIEYTSKFGLLEYSKDRTFQLKYNACFFSITDPKSAPRFALVGERSLNGVPTVSVTFPNGHEDTLILDRHYSSEEDRIGQVEACNYIGHLEKDPEACVAMTGCVGSEDVEFTIMSEHATESPMFKWTKEDTVEIIEHPYLVEKKTFRTEFCSLFCPFCLFPYICC